MHTTKVIISKFSYYRLLLALSVLAICCGSAAAQLSYGAGNRSNDSVEMASASFPSAPSANLHAPDAAIEFQPAFAPVVAIAPRDGYKLGHPFWDRENSILFAATGAAATADFFVTHMNLSGGGRELNPLVRPLAGSTAGLATNFAVETASVMAISYVFHKTGHHRLERLTPLVNTTSSIGAVTYGIMHR